jgi:hypothetical protein
VPAAVQADRLAGQAFRADTSCLKNERLGLAARRRKNEQFYGQKSKLPARLVANFPVIQ